MNFRLVQTTAPDHLYAVVNRAIADGLRRLGHQAQILPAPAGARLDQIVGAIHAAAPDQVISLGSFLGALAADNGVSIFDILSCGFIGWQFDHPLYTEHNLAAPMTGRFSVYPNASHAAFATRLGVSGESTVLLAGGTLLGEPVRAWRDRSIPILVAATYNGRPERPWDSLSDGTSKTLVKAVHAHLVADPEASLAAACDAVRADFGLGPDMERALAEPLRRLLTFMRHKDRLDAITALVESGLPVTMVGDGWGEHFGDRPNLTARPSIPFTEANRLYNDARVVLHVNAANGGCERTIQAMLAGAAVVSDASGGYAAMGIGADDLRMFDRTRPATLAHLAAELLDGDGEQVAEAGWRKATTSQLWDHRLAALLEAVGR